MRDLLSGRLCSDTQGDANPCVVTIALGLDHVNQFGVLRKLDLLLDCVIISCICSVTNGESLSPPAWCVVSTLPPPPVDPFDPASGGSRGKGGVIESEIKGNATWRRKWIRQL